MTPRIIGLPRLHAAQIQIVSDPHRFKVVAAGRRFGKGVLGVSEGFIRASRGLKCRWVSPSYASDSFQSGWNEAAYLAGQIPGVTVHQQRKQFDFSAIGGAWLQFRTSEEPDALRGEGIDFVVFDEAAHVKELQQIWEQCVRPSLMDRSGDAWFISTPKGFNYFNTLYLRARDDKDWASFQYATGDNPTIAPEEIEALKHDMPALVARQEIDAEFVQLAGALFKRENIRVLETEPVGVVWVCPWDLAWTEKTTSDYTVGGRVGMTEDGTIVVADVVRARCEWPEAVRLVKDTATMYGPTVRQGIEVVGAQLGMLQTVLRDPLLANISFEPIEVHKDKLTRALPLVSRSEQGKFAIVHGGWNKDFIDELMSFPEGQHDDQVDFASGALTMISEPTGAFSSEDIRTAKTGVPEYRPESARISLGEL